MAFMDFFGKKKDTGGDIDIEEHLKDLSIREGRIIESEDVVYVKPIEIDNEGKGVANVIKEIEKGNMVVLNIRALLNNKVGVKSVVKEIREAVVGMDGDLGKISDEKLLIVPTGMRIVHKAQEPA